jgi:hypothetical protein
MQQQGGRVHVSLFNNHAVLNKCRNNVWTLYLNHQQNGCEDLSVDSRDTSKDSVCENIILKVDKETRSNRRHEKRMELETM